MAKFIKNWRQWLKPTLIGGLIGFTVSDLPDWYDSFKELANPPFAADMSSTWVPEGRLSVIYCKTADRTMSRGNVDLVMVLRVVNKSSQPVEIADYSLEAKLPNGKWTQIEKVLVPSDNLYTEYIDGTNATPKYLDFSKDTFHILARLKPIEPERSIEGWSLFNFGYKPDLMHAKFRLTLYDIGGEEIQQTELREGHGMNWVSFKVLTENPYPICQ